MPHSQCNLKVKAYNENEDPLLETDTSHSSHSVGGNHGLGVRSSTIAHPDHFDSLHHHPRTRVSEKSVDEWEELDDRHLALFQALERTSKKEKSGIRTTLLKILREKGVELKDPRFIRELKSIKEKEEELTPQELKDVFKGKLRLLHKFVEGKLAVKKFSQLEA